MQQPSRSVQPEQLVQGLMPIVTEATKVFDMGASMQSALREAVLAGFLVGRGLAPAQAMETVLQWRMARTAPSLAREMRTEAPTTMAVIPTVDASALSDQAKSELVPLIQKFMQDQANAAAFYQELQNQVPGEDLKDYVNHAREDEQKHYRMLGELYRELTGRTYEATAQKIEFPDLASGLKRAMDDEYEAAEEYRDVYLKYNNRRVRDLFFELMTDELEHATRFNYVLQRLG